MTPEATAAPEAPAVRVLLVEDQRAFNDAISIALGTADGATCLASTASVAEALAFLDHEDVDTVLMDVDLPDIDGIEGTRRVKAAHPEISVVILTSYADLDTFVRAVAAGADGFLAKDSPFEVIVDAVLRRSCDGLALEKHTVEALRSRVGDSGALRGRAWMPSLTDRERDVLSLLASGLDPQMIARQLGIRVHTCRGYVRNVLVKLGAHSQLEAVALARQSGLLELT